MENYNSMNLSELGFKKSARIFEMDDVENEMGMYFNDSLEPYVRKAVNAQYDKRFVLRHPWLTGIPTLGIAPAISKANATEEVKRQLVRKNSGIMNEYKAYRQQVYDRYQEAQRMQIEKDKANQLRYATENLGNAYLGGKLIDSDKK